MQVLKVTMAEIDALRREVEPLLNHQRECVQAEAVLLERLRGAPISRVTDIAEEYRCAVTDTKLAGQYVATLEESIEFRLRLWWAQGCQEVA